MTIAEVYTHYRTPSNLQEHLYRVTAVGLTIVRALSDTCPMNERLITSTLLLHDMGNILKFDLSSTTSGFSETERARLQTLQDEYRSLYGKNEHEATIAIAHELNMSSDVIDLLERASSDKMHAIVHERDWPAMLAVYADMRVSPSGIVSVNERMDDLLERYKRRAHPLSLSDMIELLRTSTLEAESLLQAHARIDLAAIDDESVAVLLNELRKYEL
jgi:hypothetical protein